MSQESESRVRQQLEGLVEELAAIEHARWAHWQSYVHSKGMRCPNGDLILDAELIKRWEKQIETSYADLTEIEKQSDRDQVREYVELIVRKLGSQ